MTLTNDQMMELLRETVDIVDAAELPSNFAPIAFEIVAKRLFEDAQEALRPAPAS